MCYGGGGIEFTYEDTEEMLKDPDNRALFNKVMIGKLDTKKGYLAYNEETKKLIWVKGQMPS